MTSGATFLLPSGRLVSYRRFEHESAAEFSGRVWCAAEERIMGKRGATPKGTRVAVWWQDGHYVKGLTGPFGSLHESTGNLYADRWARLPGLFDETAARQAIKG